MDVAKAVVNIARDPHLPELTCHVLRMADMEAGRVPGPPCAPVSLKVSPGVGIGLRYAVVPVRIAVKAREHPWRAAAIVAAVVVGIFGIGVVAGRSRRSKPAGVTS